MRTIILKQKWISTKEVTSQAVSSCMGIWPICPTPNRIDMINTAFDKVPEELIEKIFHLALSDQWQGKEVPLLVALRGTPRLYKIAIKAFCDHNTFNLTKKNRFSLGRLSVQSKNLIKHVKWTLAYDAPPPRYHRMPPIRASRGFDSNANRTIHATVSNNTMSVTLGVGAATSHQTVPILAQWGIQLANMKSSCLTLDDLPAAGRWGRGFWVIPADYFENRYSSPSLFNACKWHKVLHSMPRLESIHLDFSAEFAYADLHAFEGLVQSIAAIGHRRLRRLVVELNFITYSYIDQYLLESLRAIQDLNPKILPKLLTVGTCNNVQFLWLAEGTDRLFPIEPVH